MARTRKAGVSDSKGNQKPEAVGATPAARSQANARRGIRTTADFKETMSNLMTDLITGEITPQTANAVCNAGGKLLKVVEMEHRLGGAGRHRTALQLTS